MKKSTVIIRMQGSLVWITVMILAFSCKENSKVEIIPVEKGSSFLPPVAFLLDTMPPPKIVELKNVPPPRIIAAKPPVVTEVPMPSADFTNFDTQHGLALNGVFDGVKDNKGRLWFGTGGGGVSCYDGLKFTNFSVEQGFSFSTNCLAADKNGDLWFSDYGSGIYKYDGTRITRYL